MNVEHTLMATLGMEQEKLTKEEVILSMPVDERTHQPMGFLHGGASVALAETAASIGAYLNVDPTKFNVFGMEINANHVKSKRDGKVRAIAKPVHIGSSSMVFEIHIADEEEALISISRCTIGVVPKKS
ncbi:esterase [Pontibacillus halophilus JSM 076056 = DSM 19796]|uniref:Esterase n=1 Tax=Pontibacillus halophilus JSM 076056 = DSM 19796 TaxID=1385510 RepID=A0A0A5GE93_9BACI|nr:hotdog fold thioesterase [Pontibacillus halophilus]KGX89518.1 esterase [Pontibacillus halophilus JSM 076056 = DSM 19796]